MNILRLLFVLLCSTTLFAQEESEIFLLDIQVVEDAIKIKDVKNISNNKGYDNQPSFASNYELLYAGTENNQTEIMLYTVGTDSTIKVNAATPGGEYSPQKFPNKATIAAVRLDPDGLQRLYKYEIIDDKPATSTELLANYKVAYFAFHDDSNIVATIIENEELVLIKANLTTGEVIEITGNAGRSIHKVPGTDNISYTAVNEDGVNEVYIINIAGDNESYYVCDLPIGIQDHCWFSSSELLIGSGSILYKYDLFGNGKWEKIADISSNNISEISRITVSPDKTKIALAARPATPENSPGTIVDAHITPFNNKKLRAFSEAFAEDVIVKRFPDDTTQTGRQELHDSYKRFFDTTESFNVSVLNRIVHNDWVIDEEKVVINDKTYSQATLYRTKNGLISEMTFLQRIKNNNPERVVDHQLKGYNARDINTFMESFDDTIIIINYPSTVLYKGKKAVRESYKSFFESTPNLNVTIKNRIINGNKVIDQEEVIMNNSVINAVAIYEVENDKIVKVTFLPN